VKLSPLVAIDDLKFVTTLVGSEESKANILFFNDCITVNFGLTLTVNSLKSLSISKGEKLLSDIFHRT
jgi:hypothetical protein